MCNYSTCLLVVPATACNNVQHATFTYRYHYYIRIQRLITAAQYILCGYARRHNNFFRDDSNIYDGETQALSAVVFMCK